MKDRARLVADEWLVLRSQEGDAQAFDLLISRWQDRLWRHARRLVRDDDAAWDVLQETWMSIVHGLRRLDDPEAFPGWAFRIVTFKCADHVRRVQRQRRADAGRSEDDSWTTRDKDEKVEAMRAALTELIMEQRAILSLHYLEELGVERIAEILKIPVGTVKSRLHHARAALRAKMGRGA